MSGGHQKKRRINKGQTEEGDRKVTMSKLSPKVTVIHLKRHRNLTG